MCSTTTHVCRRPLEVVVCIIFDMENHLWFHLKPYFHMFFSDPKWNHQICCLYTFYHTYLFLFDIRQNTTKSDLNMMCFSLDLHHPSLLLIVVILIWRASSNATTLLTMRLLDMTCSKPNLRSPVIELRSPVTNLGFLPLDLLFTPLYLQISVRLSDQI